MEQSRGLRWLRSVLAAPFSRSRRTAPEDGLPLAMSANAAGVFLRRVMGRDGAIRYDFVSARAEEYLGVSGPELIAEPGRFFERIHPDHREPYRRALAESGRNLAPLELEFRLLAPPGAPPGRESWLCSTSRPFPGPAGEVVWDVFLQDVSERKRAAEALLAATLRTNAILGAMVDAVITTDRAGVIDSFNAAAERSFGYAAAEVIGRGVGLLIPDALSGPLSGPLPNDGAARPAPRELLGQRRDGSVFPLELTRSESAGEGGEPLIVLVARDITARRSADADMARLTAIVHSTSDFIGCAEPDETIRYVNPAGLKLLGLPGDLGGRRLRLSDCFAVWAYRRTIEEGIPAALERGLWQGESALVNYDTGGEIPVSQVILVSRDETGAPSFIATICRDIREHKALERNLAEAREQAEEANQAKTAFLAAMSHELRTPLNAINGFSQLLLLNRKEILPEPQRQQVDTIRRAGQHLLKLIEDILDLAKIESGHLSVTLEPVSLADVAAEACEGLAELAAQAGVVLHAGDLDHTLPLVQADPTRLVQVVVNLISNAIKYNREGGSVHVSVRELPGRRVSLSVRDTGRGIAPERQGQVFEPFNRLGAELSGVEGTGIGLALSRTLTELMGGALAFVSTPGEGCTFWIELPADHGGRDRSETPQTSPLQTSSLQAGPLQTGNDAASSRLRRFRLLYIDDNADDLALMEAFLREHSEATLHTADNGERGLELARRHRPDAIVLDTRLPGGDGFATLARLRADPELTAIPVIALSAEALPASVTRGHGAGFREWLTKPLSPHRLREVLEPLVRDRVSGDGGDDAGGAPLSRAPSPGTSGCWTP